MCFQDPIYAYRDCIYTHIAINTLVHKLSCMCINVYMYRQYGTQFIMCKPLELQEAEIRIYNTHNGVLQKLLQGTIKKHLDSTRIVLTKQHYHCYYKSSSNLIT